MPAYQYGRQEPFVWTDWFYFDMWRGGFKVHGERKSWDDYMEQLKENDLVLHSRRRCPANIPDAWDDYDNASKQHHHRCWKTRTKCKKQWMKNLPV